MEIEQTTLQDNKDMQIYKLLISAENIETKYEQQTKFNIENPALISPNKKDFQNINLSIVSLTNFDPYSKNKKFLTRYIFT